MGGASGTLGSRGKIYRLLVWKSQELRRGPRLRWQHISKVYLKKKEDELLWLKIRRVSGRCKHGNKLWGSAICSEFLTGWEALNFSDSILLCEVCQFYMNTMLFYVINNNFIFLKMYCTNILESCFECRLLWEIITTTMLALLMTVIKNLNVVRPSVMEKSLDIFLLRICQSVRRTHTQTHLHLEGKKLSLFNRKSGMMKLKKGWYVPQTKNLKRPYFSALSYK
jgi:hypothetical protein